MKILVLKRISNVALFSFILGGCASETSTEGGGKGGVGAATAGGSSSAGSAGGESAGGSSQGGSSTDSDSVGSDSVGSDSVGSDSVGSDSVGSDSVGSDSVGSDSVGSDSVGSDSQGGDSSGGGNQAEEPDLEGPLPPQINLIPEEEPIDDPEQYYEDWIAQCQAPVIKTAESFDYAEVASFCQNQGQTNDLVLIGDFRVWNRADLLDLDDLSCLCVVSGKVEIGAEMLNYEEIGARPNAKLTNLQGLAGLRLVGEDLIIAYNYNLTSLGNFPLLNSIGGALWVERNTKLPKVGDFPALQELGALRVEDNFSLNNIGDFSALEKVKRDFWLRFNPSLTNIGDFSTLAHVGRDLWIEENNALQTLTGLASLEKIGELYEGYGEYQYYGGGLRISYNSALETIDSFSSLLRIGSLSLSYNDSLLTLNGVFPKLSHIFGGDLDVYRNDALMLIDDFAKFRVMKPAQSIGEYFTPRIEISYNDNLTKIASFSMLEILDGDVSIRKNPQLVDLGGFPKLKFAHDVQLISNPLSEKLGDFGQLEVIAGEFTLSDFETPGLGNSFKSLASVFGEMKISFNPNLNSFGTLSQLKAVGLNGKKNYGADSDKNFYYGEGYLENARLVLAHLPELADLNTLSVDYFSGEALAWCTGLSEAQFQAALPNGANAILSDYDCDGGWQENSSGGWQENSSSGWQENSSGGWQESDTEGGEVPEELSPWVEKCDEAEIHVQDAFSYSDAKSICENTVNDVVLVGDLHVFEEPVANLALGCLCVVTGDVEIGSTQKGPNFQLVTLGGLSGLRAIGGDFSIENNPSLTNLAVFDFLEKLRGDLIIRKNSSLDTVGDFPVLSDLGTLLVNENAVITGFGDFTQLTTVRGDFEITKNALLKTVSGFGGITNILGDFRIHNHPELTTIASFGALKTIGWMDDYGDNDWDYVGGDIDIENNTVLNSIGVFESLERSGPIYIRYNPELLILQSFPVIAEIYGVYDGEGKGGIDISNNANLQSIVGMPKLHTMITGYEHDAEIVIVNNNALQSIGDFSLLKTPLRDLTISSNKQLKDLGNFSGLTNINGYMILDYFAATSLGESFAALESVTRRILIYNAAELTTLGNLGNLKSVGSSLWPQDLVEDPYSFQMSDLPQLNDMGNLMLEVMKGTAQASNINVDQATFAASFPEGTEIDYN